jgi:hypothetical protein
MPWLKVDDKFTDHPKIAGLSDAAFRLHMCGLTYCARHLTDGRVPANEVPRLVRRLRKAAVDELIREGIWREMRPFDKLEAYEIHDYLQWNDSKEHVMEKRDAWAERQRRAREARKANTSE